jgi:hypothetical protein
MNSRRCERSPCTEKIRIAWEGPNGEPQFALGHCLDISATGLAVKLRVPIEKQTYVNLRSEQIRLSGRASVRYCIRRNGAYHIGLEFSAGLQYKKTSTSFSS